MKLFDRDGKINFVDENNVLLGYDMNQDCCETADWFISDSVQDEAQERPTEIPSLDGFVFDTAFFKHVDGRSFDEGGMAIFRIHGGGREKFIHIHNSHNGYYSHGFKFAGPGGVVREGAL